MLIPVEWDEALNEALDRIELDLMWWLRRWWPRMR